MKRIIRFGGTLGELSAWCIETRGNVWMRFGSRRIRLFYRTVSGKEKIMPKRMCLFGDTQLSYMWKASQMILMCLCRLYDWGSSLNFHIPPIPFAFLGGAWTWFTGRAVCTAIKTGEACRKLVKPGRPERRQLFSHHVTRQNHKQNATRMSASTRVWHTHTHTRNTHIRDTREMS